MRSVLDQDWGIGRQHPQSLLIRKDHKHLLASTFAHRSHAIVVVGQAEREVPFLDTVFHIAVRRYDVYLVLDHVFKEFLGLVLAEIAERWPKYAG